MAVTKHTLTGDLGTIAGTSFLDSTGYAQSVRAWLETNLAGDALIDTLGNVVMLGVLPVALADDLTFTQPNLVATNSTDVNPTGVQYRMHVSYPDLSRNQQKEWVSNWFDLTANVNLADVVAAVATPPNYAGDLITEINALIAAGETELAGQVAAAEADMAAKLTAGQVLLDAQIDFSGIDDSDSEVAALVAGTAGAGPLTRGALAASTIAIGDARYAGLADLPVPLEAATTDSSFDTLLAALPAGASVDIPPNVTVTLNATHTLTKKVTIGGQGTLKDGRTTPSAGSPLLTIGPGASGTRIECHLAGSVPSGTYVSGHHAINVAGTDNGAATPPTFVTDLVLKPKSISGFGSVGIYGEFIKDYVIDVDVVKEMGYGGVLLLSAINGTAKIQRLRDLSPGTGGNMYALQFTRRGASSDLVRYPCSSNFNGWVGEMHGVHVWDGVGTHGGQDGVLGWGSMYDVKKPVDVTAATDAAGEQAYAPNNITINVGSADSGVTNGTMGPAVTINGAFKSTDVLGTPTEYAKGIVVNPGSIKGYGIEGGANDGAYYIYATQGLVGILGSCVEPSPFAVNLYHTNKDFYISVTALDPWTTAGSEAGVVHCSSDYNTGVVEFSGGSRGAKTATIVYNRGLSVKNVGTNAVRLGTGCNFSGATVPIATGPVYVWLDAAVKLGAQLRALAGTAGAPAYTFEQDLTTGLLSQAAGDMSVSVSGVVRARWLASALTFTDAYNIGFGTTTGTKLGTATTHKLGFWGKTPVVQPSGTPAAATDLATALTLVNDLRTKLLSVGIVA